MVLNENNSLSKSQFLVLVFFPFAFAHFISFVFRSVNAVLAPNLMESINLTPNQLGILTSAYFFAFALGQLPIGIMLDRYGPRRVQCVLLCVATLGALMFAVGNNFLILTIARAIIGFGLAACFMGAIKAISYYIPPQKLPSIHSYLIALGGLGAMTSTLPIKITLHFTSWHGVFYMLAAVTFIIALLIYFLAPTNYTANNKSVSISSLLQVYSEPNFRKTISLILIPHTVFFGIQGMWIGQYLQDVGHYSQSRIDTILFINMTAIVAGTISVGKITEWLSRFGIETISVAGGGIILFIFIQSLILLNIPATLPYLSILFMLFGTCCGLEYTIVAQNVPPDMTGRAATCLNVLILSGAFVIQALFGGIIGLWKPDINHHYPVLAYQVALGIFILFQLPGVVSWLLNSNYNKALNMNSKAKI